MATVLRNCPDREVRTWCAPLDPLDLNRENHGSPWGFLEQPIPAPAKNPCPHSRVRVPVLTGQGFLTGLQKFCGFPHYNGWRVFT
jgi:hypothetical protein